MEQQAEMVFTAPHQPHSPTSREAAALILGTLNALQGEVWELLYRRGDRGLTDEEMQLALSMNPSTQRPRRIELLGQGLIHDTGRGRRTMSGRRAVVWAVTR